MLLVTAVFLVIGLAVDFRAAKIAGGTQAGAIGGANPSIFYRIFTQ